MKKYLVVLTERERAALGRRLSGGRATARELARARILLKADAGASGPAWPDAVIAEALDVGLWTVERVRKRFAQGGLEVTLRHQRPRRDYRRKLDGEQEAHLVALACSPPPPGRRFWTLRLLADRRIELRFVDGVSYETARRLLNKNELKPWLIRRWCIPPEANGEFVWRMEDVLEVLPPAPTTPSGRRSAWMSSASSSSARPAARDPCSRGNLFGTTTSTSGGGPPTCSSGASRSAAGGTSR